MSDAHDGGPEDRQDRLERLEEAALAAEYETGRRERTEAAAKRHLLVRIGIVVAGTVVSLVGLALLVLPGPGLLVLFAGLVLLASEVPFAARLVDKVRDRLPHDADGTLPTSAIVTMVAMAVLAIGGSVWFTLLR